MRHADLIGKLARLQEALRVHAGNGRSLYGERLRSEIAATKAELDALENAAPSGSTMPEALDIVLLPRTSRLATSGR